MVSLFCTSAIMNYKIDIPKLKNSAGILHSLRENIFRPPTITKQVRASTYDLICDYVTNAHIAEVDKPSITLPVNPHAVGELCTLQDIASDIYEVAIENVGHIYDNEITVVHVIDAREVEEGRVFCDKDILKLNLSLFTIQNMFEFMVEQSDKKEYVVRCSQEVCSWICRASRWGKMELFKIWKIGGHTCASNVVLGSHKQLSAIVVSFNTKYASSCTIYTPKNICSDMLHTYGVYLNYSKAWRSCEQTLKMIRGYPTKSFGNIPSFFYMLRQKNPRTITNLEVDIHNRFSPVIVVDGTYLNGHYGGTLFITCTQDASNSVIVLAFRIGDNENDKSWRWFLENLKKAYENREGLCFNLKSHFGKSGQSITQAFNSTVRAYTLEEVKYHMRKLDTMNKKISTYLAEVEPEKWSRIHMPKNRYSTMTSNIVELVYAITKVSNSNQSVFSVSGDKTTFVVDIEKQTCTCRMLQVDLLPYPHTLAVIANIKRDPYTFCSYYYTHDAYLNAYENSIYPVGNPSEWTLPKEVLHEIVLAPNRKRRCLRPTEKRKRSSREGKPSVKCGRCERHDHNRRRCSSLVSLS
ncbi:uncharacterized protein LOC111390105 [Olea europaea var. sylvestris]|uniref:uncharacterized protein LOC111390105 n=1 Tax=Olea europaea var. sylvestris TaxID=158386 RepID=UPI000C1CDBB0|nr:uncharacterized protein LOC111390105 [Olea europaea var. sylvestris]